MMRNAVCLTVLLLANAAASLAQTDPRFSTKPAGVIVSGKKLEPEKAVDLSRPNPQGALDATSSEDLYFDAAMRGEAWAQTKLGRAYLESSDDEEQRRKGIELLQKAAAQKDAEALYVLANMTAAGLGAQPSHITAGEKLQEAAELGNTEAQYELASMYAEGRGLPKDSNLALHWGQKAADQGNVKAQFSVGRVLVERPEPEQKAEALRYLRLAAGAKDQTAVIFLATVLARGDFGVTKNEYEAEATLNPLAESGDPECQFALANLYQIGEVFTDRHDMATTWLRRAADQGHAKSAEILEASGRR